MTPNTVDLFSRFMAREFDESEVIAVPTAGQTFFGRAGSQTIFSPDSNDVDIDIIRGNEKIAALIPRGMVSRSLGSNQKNLQAGKYTTFSRKYPLSEEEGDINANQILNRQAGESPYDRDVRMARMRKLGSRIHMESIRRTVRMFEVLAWQSVLTGTQDAIIGTSDTDLQYDFRRNTNLTVTPSNEWDSGSQTIMADIDGICDAIRIYGHTQPDMMVLGGEAMQAFIDDSDIQDLADNRRFELIEVGMGTPVPAKFMPFVNAGLNPRGRLRTAKGYELWLFTYVDGYTNSSDTFVNYMTLTDVLICASTARADRYFGPPEMLPMIPQRRQLYSELFGINPDAPPMPPKLIGGSNVVNPGMFHCDAYVANDWKKVTIRTQSAPIFPTTQTDAFGLLEDVVS